MHRLCKSAILATALILFVVPLQAEEPTDAQIMDATIIKWAGLNCGNLISMDDLMAAIKFTSEIDEEKAAFALRRVKFMMEKAASLQVACKSIRESL